MITKESESLLIRRIVSGEKEEFRVLVGEYKDRIFAMVMRQTGNRTLAEEITQESFVKAYINLKKFRFDSQFGTWLTRIALNETNNYFASKRFKETKNSESYSNEIHEKQLGHSEDEDQRAELEKRERSLVEFRKALATLKPKFRDVITLCSLEGRSYEEAASVLSIPIGTVRSRLNKARLLLKDAIISVELVES